MKLIGLWGALMLCACASRAPQLDSWIETQERKSWAHLQQNISPAEPKAAGEPVPEKGVVVAALSKKDPDYYFHWVRDSAHVMQVITELAMAGKPFAENAFVNKAVEDYLSLSEKLQSLPSEFGLGEPRYTVTARTDPLKWSRPQYDGPALRALTALKILQFTASPATRLRAEHVLLRDTDYVEKTWNARGFDLWEELKGDHYHTRLVQLAALEQTAAWLEKNKRVDARITRYRKIATQLETLLADHWDAARGFYRAQLAITATDGYTSKKTDIDSAVVIAVLEAGRPSGPHSVFDPKVQATVSYLEKIFREQYPINRNSGGLVYGRYPGDSYYGGNPWPLITAAFAQFYYRLGNIEKGDAIMRRLRNYAISDGQWYEQINKKTGAPSSAAGLAWSHANFLRAALERSTVSEIH